MIEFRLTASARPCRVFATNAMCHWLGDLVALRDGSNRFMPHKKATHHVTLPTSRLAAATLTFAMVYTIYAQFISIVFSVLMGLFLLRIALQSVRAPFVNPVAQWVYTMTNPILRPIQKILPTWRNFNFASLFCMFVLGLICAALIGLWAAGWRLMLVFALTQMMQVVCSFYWGLILLVIIFSFVEPRAGNAFVPIVYRLVTPLLRPIQRVLPPLGPVDFSPMVAMFALWVAQLLFSAAIAPLARPL
jgi:YggT family protein